MAVSCAVRPTVRFAQAPAHTWTLGPGGSSPSNSATGTRTTWNGTTPTSPGRSRPRCPVNRSGPRLTLSWLNPLLCLTQAGLAAVAHLCAGATHGGTQPTSPASLELTRARSCGSRLIVGVRSVIGAAGCLAMAWRAAKAPSVEVSHPLLDRRLPLLRGRGDVLDQTPGIEAEFLGHAQRLDRQSTAALCLSPALLFRGLAWLRHGASHSFLDDVFAGATPTPRGPARHQRPPGPRSGSARCRCRQGCCRAGRDGPRRWQTSRRHAQAVPGGRAARPPVS